MEIQITWQIQWQQAIRASLANFMPQALKDNLVVMVLQGASACCGITYNMMAVILPVLLPELLGLDWIYPVLMVGR